MFNVDFEVCALVFLLIIMVHFFGKYHLLTVQNAFFAFLMIIGAVDIFLDIVTSYMIDYAEIVPHMLTLGVTSLFYIIQIMLPVLLYLYVLSILHLDKPDRYWKIAILMIPGVLFSLWVLGNPFTGHFCTITRDDAYVRGPYFVYLYLTCGMYFLLVLITIIKHRKQFRDIEFETIGSFLLLLSAGIVIQYMYPNILLTGAAIALSITMVYLTLQNPDEMMDEMTGLYNRTSMIQYLNSKIESRDDVHVILVALDDMKQINNLLGIENGNKAISEVADYIRVKANQDPVFRMMGDQIAVISSQREDCMRLVHDTNQRFKEEWNIGGTNTKLSACICYVLDVKEHYTTSEMITMLEYMMGEAKSQGNGVVLEIDDSALRKKQRETAVECAVDDAIKGELFEPYFQPIYDVNSGTFTSMEVLTRLNHSEIGNIPPMEFIPLAEKKGRIVEVEEQIYRKTMEFIRRYNLDRDYGLDYVEINLSAVQLMRRDAPERIEAIIHEHHIDPSFICLEVTETAATKTFSYARRTMEKMIKSGIRFAMDDYGTGYANVDSVIQLPFSVVKIDQNVLVASENNKKSNRIFENTITLMQDLELEVVVEGAEEEEQVEHLKRIGVDYIQGYYYSKPLSASEFLEFLEIQKEI